MSTLFAMAFPDELRATEMIEQIAVLKDEGLIVLEDAVIVTKDRAGRVKLHQTHNLQKLGLLGGGGLGLVVGAILGLPLAGAGALLALPLAGSLTGAVGGLLSSKFVDIGIDDSFIRKISEQLQPSSSAIFLMVASVQLDQVLPRLNTEGGTLLHTSLPPDAEARLENAIRLVEAQLRLQAEQER